MTDDRHNAWLADVVIGLRELGGRAWLQDLYDWIRDNRKKRPPNYASVVRSTIYAHSTDAKAYVPGNPDVFRNVARGLWSLRFPDQDVPQKSTWLPGFILTHMTKEELESYSGRGPALMAELEARAADLRNKFKMT